jgi:hypothetical protein
MQFVVLREILKKSLLYVLREESIIGLESYNNIHEI